MKPRYNLSDHYDREHFFSPGLPRPTRGLLQILRWRHSAPREAWPAGLALTDLARPDIVLLSHNHYDHMDLPSPRAIHRRHAPSFITTLGNAAALRRLGIAAAELDWWQGAKIGALRITATPARHFSARAPFDRNRTLWAGFMIRDGAGRILVQGGTPSALELCAQTTV